MLGILPQQLMVAFHHPHIHGRSFGKGTDFFIGKGWNAEFAFFYSLLTIDNMPVMNSPGASDPTTKYYRSRQSAGVWIAMVITFAVIAGGSSLAAHSFWLTFSLLMGAIVVGYAGYWILSRNLYFVSSTKAGYRDVFCTCEVLFDDVRSAHVSVGESHRDLVFVRDRKNVSVPLDPMDESWLSDVKAELLKRGITVTTTAFGIPTGK
jgi:hypothetical protein